MTNADWTYLARFKADEEVTPFITLAALSGLAGEGSKV